MPGQRKSIEPMAARLGIEPQRLQQFMADSPWDEYPRKARLFWVRHEHFHGLAQFRGLRCCGKIEQARWVAWQLWPSSFLV
jgi:DDE superfamily endonuclease